LSANWLWILRSSYSANFQLNANFSSFADIAEKLGRSETWVAAAFYGNMPFAQEDIDGLVKILEIDPLAVEAISPAVNYFPDRASKFETPPRDPTIYRLYEIVLVYGYAFKSIIAEKFGDGIMSAICFTSKIDKEVDEEGTWVKVGPHLLRRKLFLILTQFIDHPPWQVPSLYQVLNWTIAPSPKS
jgi:cyanate lyase